MSFPSWFQLQNIIDLSALPKEMRWPESRRIRDLEADCSKRPTTITFHDYRKPLSWLGPEPSTRPSPTSRAET